MTVSRSKTFRHHLLMFLIAAVYPVSGSSQGLTGLATERPSIATSTQPEDALRRRTPRSATRSFLEACHRQHYDQAALYLNLQNLPSDERSSRGPDLAKQLADILDRDSQFELANLSDAPGGNSADALDGGRELLVSVPTRSGNASLYLEREPRQYGGIWLVAPESVRKIQDLREVSQQSALEKRLPAFLVTNKLLGTSVWIWLALVIVASILSLVSRFFSRTLISLCAPLAKRYAGSLHTYRFEAFTEPLRLLLSISVFRAVIEFLDPSALLRDYLLKFLTLMFAFGAASLSMRIIDVAFDRIQSRLNSRERALTYSVLPLAMRLLKVLVFCIFALFTLSGWGYNTTTILAGLGVGGLAVALAAQKTIENFFGGVSVITDRPVLVGDFCQFGGQVGTVEDIGLRSTRIRTLDRTVVTIPNSQFSTMTLENYSRRDRMWFHPTLKLRRGTTSEQVTQFMETMTEILKSNPLVSVGGVPLRFTKIDDQSLHIEIFAYIMSSDFDIFLKEQSELLLQILKAGEGTGISFAMPIVESININPPSTTKLASSTPA